MATAVPYLVAAAFFLGAQNPPLDAARLDIMPPLLWGRAEAVRTMLRSLAMALAPLLFGAVSDHVFGGGRVGPAVDVHRHDPPARRELRGSCSRALRTYPGDVADGRRERRRRARVPSTAGPLGSVMSTGDIFLFLSAFLASGVEFVEALTIVLAVGARARLALVARRASARRRSRSPSSSRRSGRR